MTDQVHSYATLQLIVRYGAGAAVALAMMMLAAFGAIFVAYELPVWTLLAAVVGAVVIYGLLRSYVEIVQVISETLLPR